MKGMRGIYRIAALVVFSILAVQASGKVTADSAGLNKKAALDLIQRILPAHAAKFEVAYIPQENGKDVFELESRKGKIILKGNNGISVASAFNYWLKNYAHCDISWSSSNLKIPSPFPMVEKPVRKVTPHQYRHYFNYCTFNYTASWWDWDRWQWEIDYMALNGINMPLAMTGQNAIWDRVYRNMGFGDTDMDAFFTGPAYFMWFWAGNIDAWGGPLPKSWLTSHEALQKKILARERELGMKPILPAFTGHVPPTFKDKFPKANLKKINWEGRFDDTYILDPNDSLFNEIGNRFMEEQIKTFGTDHLYGADTFNEMYPPSNDSLYLDNISSAVYKSMARVDPQAVWVMQGWLFVDKKDFWQPAQIKAYLNAVPENKLIVLDLWAEENPVWNRTDAFYGKPWIWSMLHNFGGRNSLYGNLAYLAKEPAEMVHDPNAGNMLGIGLVPEGIEQNPVVYSLMLDHVWDNKSIDLDKWLVKYAERRYGKRNKDTEEAWKILKNTAYANEGNYESIIIARPTFQKDNDWAATDIPYNPAEFLKSWTSLMNASRTFGSNDCYQYDLVAVGRQVMANYATILQQRFAQNFRSRNNIAFKKNTAAFLELIDDMDKLMATRKDLLLGSWLNDAKKWGTNEQEKRLYEKNARNLITLWGGKDAVLHEYAYRYWSGLFSGFYKKRWEMFIEDAGRILKTGTEFNQKVFDEKIKDWEWKWVNGTEVYPDQAQGNPVTVAAEMYKKYAARIAKEYKDNPELTENK